MVLVNERKYACGTCIKGHRVSGCTHTDRPLFEVKKKGRPTTQCVHCREKRKNSISSANGPVHTKCACGEPKPVNVLMPGATTPVLSNEPYPTSTRDESPPPSATEILETRKGQPGSNPTFPNGLKDVHDMAAAAEALSDLGTESENMKVAERKVASLLNPCHCTTGGPCKCCQPKRERADSLRTASPHSNGSRTPTSIHGNVTDSLIEMFKSKATTHTPPEQSTSPHSHLSLNTSAPPLYGHSANLLGGHNSYISPNNMHHPAHTSPHIHKTRLYSPYTTSGHSTPRHGRREATMSAITREIGWCQFMPRSPPRKLRPLADMNKFLGAVFREDGSVADEIPRSALGLPGISTFDSMAESGGVKIEPMEMEVDAPIQFPTHEDVVIGGCTCGEGCECAGCATHGNPPNPGGDSHVHHSGCGDNCKSSFHCGDQLSIPSGITSIGHLLSIAAANVPPPARPRPSDLSAHAQDIRVLPPAVQVSEEAARALGVVTLKPLECCNGRCQCPPGKCVCEKDCCGCCIRCACDEDGDQQMGDEPAKSCCSTDAPIQQPPQPAPQESCCSAANPTSSNSSPHSDTPPILSLTPTVPVSSGQTSTLLHTDAAPEPSRQPSPQPKTQSSSNTLRRSSSTSQNRNATLVSASRRATIAHGNNVQRSASTGKQASKALALHTTPGHPHSHPRPILPKPPSGQQVGQQKNASASGSRMPTPTRTSSQSSRQASPAFQPQANLDSQPHSTSELPGPSIAVPTLPNMSNTQQDGQSYPANFSPNNPAGFNFPDLSIDDDIMAFINSLTNSVEADGSYQVASSDSSGDQPLTTPELSFDQAQPFDQDTAMANGYDPEFLELLNNATRPDEVAQQQGSLPPAPLRTSLSPSSPSANPPPNDAISIGTFTDDNQPGFPQSMVDLFIASNNVATGMEPDLIYQQLPPQSTAFLQEMFATNPIFTHPAVNNNHPVSDTGEVNPNMIDLSKPLNSSDVERILRALQEQQARQSSSPTQHNPKPPLPASIPQHSLRGAGYDQSPNNFAPSIVPGTAYIGNGSNYSMGFVKPNENPLDPMIAHSGQSHVANALGTTLNRGNLNDLGTVPSTMDRWHQGEGLQAGVMQNKLFYKMHRNMMGI